MAAHPAGARRAPHRAPTRYPHLLRTDSARWWRALVGLSVLVLVFAGCGIGIYVVGYLAVLSIDDPQIVSETDLETFSGPAGLLVGNLTLAAGGVAAVAAVAWAHRERAGWLLSVTRRLRPRLLLVAAAITLAGQVAGIAVAAALPATDVEAVAAVDTADAPGWPGVAAFAGLAAVILLTTPLQAAGEELVFRGYLVQAAGTWTRSLWLPGVLTSLLFAAAHGPQDPWLFADRLLFGLVAWALAVRTGGLEAPIAMHVVNNLAALLLAAAVDDLDATITVTDIGAAPAAANMALILIIGLAIDRYARRRGTHATTADPADLLRHG